MKKNMDQQLVDVFKALSDDNRMQIVKMLSDGEMCACVILKKLHITQPTLSHHMKVLSACGLVDVNRKGVWMHYSLNQEKLMDVKTFFQSVFERFMIQANVIDCIHNKE